MNKVELQFKDRVAIDRGTYFLFAKRDAIDFVHECEKESIIILGVESFYKINEETIQPSMENSIDYSSFDKKQPPVAYEKVIEFLNSKVDELFFEINCAE